MRTYTSTLLLCLISSVAFAAAPQSRLETDFTTQKAHLRAFEGPTSEPSCSGTGLAAFFAGKELRKLEWEIITSQRFILREFYYSHGKPDLVIETSRFRLDDQAYPLKTPRLEYVRRYWLHDQTVGPEGTAIRRELLDHAAFLQTDFRSHRADFHPTPK